MATPLDSLAQQIATLAGIGAYGTALFANHMPDAADGSLDTCTAIYNSGGAPPALTRGDDTDYPSFQIRARSIDADVALANLKTIFQALHGLTETALFGTRFKLIEFKQSNPVSLGRDEKQRFEFVLNLGCIVAGTTR